MGQEPGNLVVRVAGTLLWSSLVIFAPLHLQIDTAYWATALLSCMIFYVAQRPTLLEIGAMLFASIVLGCVYLRAVMHRFTWPTLGLCLAELGLGALLVVGLRILWTKSQEERSVLLSQVMVPTSLLILFLYASHNLINPGLFHPRTLDLYAYSFDGSLGFQPSFVLGKLVLTHPWFGWPTTILYYSVLLPIPLAYAAYNRKFGTERRFFMLAIFFTASFLGYLFYNLFPAAGPVYVFGRDFPWAPVPAARLYVESILLDMSFMRNALPSLHMAWALLIWWNMKSVSRLLSWLAFVFLLFTVCGTLGTGEHYAVDLVVSFPFALMVQAICTSWVPMRSPTRYVPIVGGLVGTLTWIALLRYAIRLFWISPLVGWGLIALTIVLSLIGVHNLRQAARAELTETAESRDLCPA